MEPLFLLFNFQLLRHLHHAAQEARQHRQRQVAMRDGGAEGAGLGALGIGEVIFERSADEFVAGTAGERDHLIIHVGDDAEGVGGHKGVDVGLDKRTGVELLVAQALVDTLGEPLLSSTLLLPGHDEPMSDGWTVNDEIGHALDAVLDSGDCGTEPTTVIDLTGDEVEIIRRGSGDPELFEG